MEIQMADNIDGPEITLYASGDLSSYQFHGITMDTSGYAKLADDADDPVEAPIGALQNKPSAAGQPAVVRISGVAKVMGGATVAPGIAVTIDGDGHFIAATANDWVWGVTLETMVSGSVTKILLGAGQGGAYTAPS
uniref:Head decoration protein n=1 Tax=viral metagenome TaxID=1070528 RepID=A0A6M3JA85_9ZZZZ